MIGEIKKDYKEIFDLVWEYFFSAFVKILHKQVINENDAKLFLKRGSVYWSFGVLISLIICFYRPYISLWLKLKTDKSISGITGIANHDIYSTIMSPILGLNG